MVRLDDIVEMPGVVFAMRAEGPLVPLLFVAACVAPLHWFAYPRPTHGP